jgi:hypothetical protein
MPRRGLRRRSESASWRAFVISYLDDDFAMLARREAALEGRGCLGECECRVDRNAKLAAIQEFCDLDQLLPVRFHDEVRPFPRWLRGDRDEAASPREHGGRAHKELAADRVEDEIDRFELIVELPAPAVDNFIRSERKCSLGRITWQPRQRPSCVAN